jgi:trimeric autotransporter adhesin
LNASFPDGTTHLLNTVVVVGTGSNCVPTAEQNADCSTDTGVSQFRLNVTKTNNAPIVTLVLPGGGTANLPTADEGSTVTYTLNYNVGNLSVDNGIITDVLPAGLAYVTGSATSDSQFTFAGYNTGTRTLTWNAETVTENGTLTYQAKVLTGASALSQPLTNTATIVSEETSPDTATSDVFVPVIPKGETFVPTPPPTDTLAPTGPTNPGSSMVLLLAVLGILVGGLVFITPVPVAVKRRNRR